MGGAEGAWSTGGGATTVLRGRAHRPSGGLWLATDQQPTTGGLARPHTRRRRGPWRAPRGGGRAQGTASGCRAPPPTSSTASPPPPRPAADGVRGEARGRGRGKIIGINDRADLQQRKKRRHRSLSKLSLFVVSLPRNDFSEVAESFGEHPHAPVALAKAYSPSPHPADTHAGPAHGHTTP